MELVYLPYLYYIEKHLRIIILFLLGFVIYYFGKKLLKFIWRKGKTLYDRIRNKNTRGIK